MNIKQLSAFREVMLTGSVSAAGRNLHRSQPSISALIAGLERDLGFQLFVRRTGRLHPVPEAHYLLEESEHILGRIESAKSIMMSTRALEQGDLNLVSMPGPSVFLIPDLISRFAAGGKRIRASLITRSSAVVQQLISAQQYDVGIADVGVDGPADSKLVRHDTLKLECLCAIPRGEPLAEHTVITPADLSGLPMAGLYADHSTRIQTEAAFRSADARYERQFEAQYFIPLFAFVERGQAYSVVDPLSASSYRLYRADGGEIAFRPFQPAIHLMASIVTPVHRAPSLLVSAFGAALKQELRAIRDYWLAHSGDR